MSTITAEIDGRTLTVDLSEVNAWDAMAWNAAGLGALEAAIAGVTDPDALLLAPGLALVAWLWERQNGSPNISVEAVARTVPVYASPPPEGAGGLDAPEAG